MQNEWNENEWNGYADMDGNWNMNLSIIVLCTELRPSYERLRYHMLDISFSYSLLDEWRSEIPPHSHVFLAWKISFFFYFFDFSNTLY
jgi:hypothetical protein